MATQTPYTTVPPPTVNPPPTTPVVPPGSNGGYTGYGSSQGSSTSYVPQYNSLPQGVANAGAGNNSAYTYTVQPQATVQEQMNGLLASNSPYLNQARQAGVNMANARGLLNSSIAAGNSENAAIQSAMPIASQDASAYLSTGQKNADMLNQIRGTAMQTAAQRAAAASAAGAARYGADQQTLRQREELAYGGEQAGLNRSFQQYMSNLNSNNSIRQQAFQYGGQMSMNAQNFRNQMGTIAAQNPFLMADGGHSLQGFMDFMNGPMNDQISQYLDFGIGNFGGG